MIMHPYLGVFLEFEMKMQKQQEKSNCNELKHYIWKSLSLSILFNKRTESLS